MIPGSSYTYILRLSYLGNQDTLVFLGGGEGGD